ncbi:AAA family ATPase [Nocardioides sp. 1609]|uniref:AAA family ATPase n=1 Tax=Nocardioides sp. 1609 TaxID=2508327 RepID=UPI001FD70DD5|nr:AAA family ATPase [Nocardioides sp. 1609]
MCVDGPGGSGKTTLARALAAATGAPVVHMDDLYDGWAGLDRVDAQLATLLVPLAAGEPGRYRRYDWHAGAFAGAVTVAPHDLTGDLLVVEGVGSGSSTYADLTTVLVWVEAPRDVRLRRGIERDGGHLRKQWLAWQDAEDAHHARHRTRERADLLVDGTAPAG